MEIKLETGRYHQIRAQFSKEGHPIFGDFKYSPKRVAELFSRPALHAWKISFTHPIQGPFHEKKISIESDIPDEFKSF